MNQIERITHMETILNEAKETVSSLEQALDRYEALRSRLPELEAYYSGGRWRQDYDDDCAGKIPSDLKRGVLSEDAVYNLLIDNHDLLERLKNFKICLSTLDSQSQEVEVGYSKWKGTMQ